MEAEKTKTRSGQANGQDAAVHTDDTTSIPQRGIFVTEENVKNFGLRTAAVIGASWRMTAKGRYSTSQKRIAEILGLNIRTVGRCYKAITESDQAIEIPGKAKPYIVLQDREIQAFGLLGAGTLAVIRSFGKMADGKCWASHAKMAERLGVSRRTVIRTIKDLLAAEAIRHIPGGGKATKAYAVIAKSDQTGADESDNLSQASGQFVTGESDNLAHKNYLINNSLEKTPSMPGDGTTYDDLDRKNGGLGRGSKRQRKLTFTEKIRAELRECGYPLLSQHLTNQALDRGILSWRKIAERREYNPCEVSGIAEQIIVHYAGHPWGSCSLLTTTDALYLPGQANIDYSSTDQAAAWW